MSDFKLKEIVNLQDINETDEPHYKLKRSLVSTLYLDR